LAVSRGETLRETRRITTKNATYLTLKGRPRGGLLLPTKPPAESCRTEANAALSVISFTAQQGLTSSPRSAPAASTTPEYL